MNPRIYTRTDVIRVACARGKHLKSPLCREVAYVEIKLIITCTRNDNKIIITRF